MRSMKREIKLLEWTRLIVQRIESGKTVEEFCDEHGLNKRCYSYWQNRVSEATLKNAVTFSDGIAPMMNSMAVHGIEVTNTAEPFVKIPNPGFPRPARDDMAAMSVRIGRAECEIYNGADAYVIERALLTLVKI